MAAKSEHAALLYNQAQGIAIGADGMGWSPDPQVLVKAADHITNLERELANYKRVLPTICCEGSNPNCMGPSGCLLAAIKAPVSAIAPTKHDG